jgi:hypothetical protein
MAQVTGTYPRPEGAQEPRVLDGISTETPRVQAKAGMFTPVKRACDHHISREGCGSTRGRQMGRRAVTVSLYPPTPRHESSGYQAAAAVVGCP